ncbi:DUF3253 domain-containing protein [Haloferula sp. A504]|uniref:DUF3253 domain-containing protein n=1 Tax=Haloferula sp. A504 TaxID=3373601 RepID=UPI0037A7499E
MARCCWSAETLSGRWPRPRSQTLRRRFLTTDCSMPESKICQRCGRTIEWRSKWKDHWDEVRYCSASCRKKPAKDRSAELKQAILELLRSRPRTASICPSEAARLVDPASWRDLMEPTRRAARLLHSEDQVSITQGGKAVDPSTAKGPIRIRRGARFPNSITP